MRAAIELRGARAEEAAPSPEFVSDLGDRLGRELEGGPTPLPPPRITRRQVLEGAGIAAAAAGVAVAIDRTAFAPSSQPSAQQQLSPNTGTWHTVALTSALAEGAVTRFDTPAAVGFVTNDRGALRAVSGVCTHQGCLLQANQSAGRLDCPCHQTAFSLSGDLLFAQLPTPPGPLPRLQVREQNGQVQVLLPPPV
ncbi:MAG TPA: Rieske (2Fe-2S) protein [Acidimicrobiales bacterium]|nr:Rieske (2Fe-2S) protein [Acidimicrobiales bacterium]